jgi:hypothetical protein
MVEKNKVLEVQLAELRACVDRMRSQLTDKGAAVVSQIQEAKARSPSLVMHLLLIQRWAESHALAWCLYVP